MGDRRGKYGGGRDCGDTDLERFRENVLDHPDEETAISGSNLDNSSNTGPVTVKVVQDGIGRTGGIVIAIIAGLALGLAIMSVVLMGMRDRDRDIASQQSENRVMEQLRKTETEARMVQYYLQDPSFRTKAELEEWARYKGIQDQQEKGK